MSAFTLVLSTSQCHRLILPAGVVASDTAKGSSAPRIEVFGIVLERSGVITSAAGRCGALGVLEQRAKFIEVMLGTVGGISASCLSGEFDRRG